MRAISRRIVRLESRAALVRKQVGHKHRIEFVSVGAVPGTPGPTVGVMLMGGGWTQAERAAALQEDAELARRYPDRDN